MSGSGTTTSLPSAHRTSTYCASTWVGHPYGSLNAGGKGTVFGTAEQKRGRQYPVQQFKKVTLRTTFTHIAMICDDAALQPLLPQVIVANTRAVLRKAAPSTHP